MQYSKNERTSKLQREAVWSNDIRQIVKLFQETFQLGDVIRDPVEYVKEYKSQLRAAGPELKFLQLAKPDKKSPFGWRPTPLLMKLVAERGTTEKGRPLYEVDLMYQLLCDYVFGYKADREKGGVFIREILLATGLIHGDRFDDGMVTERLQTLFYNGYFAKRRDDGLPIFGGPLHFRCKRT
jgi:hypothetical protein